MQFIIHAYDGKDKDALLRRMAARPEHLKNIQNSKGKVVCAGGIIENEKPIGSFFIMDFDSKELFDEYLENEPYMIHNVWQDIKVESCNTVIINDEIVGK